MAMMPQGAARPVRYGTDFLGWRFSAIRADNAERASFAVIRRDRLRPDSRPADWPVLVTEHRVWHLERLRHGGSASLGTKVGASWAGWLAAESI